MSQRNEYGRFHLVIDEEADTSTLLLENVNRTDEHWLTLTELGESHEPLGYLRLRSISPGSHVFEVAEVRPAHGPLLHSPKIGSRAAIERIIRDVINDSGDEPGDMGDPDPLIAYQRAFAALEMAWDKVPESRRIGLMPPPSTMQGYAEEEVKDDLAV